MDLFFLCIFEWKRDEFGGRHRYASMEYHFGNYLGCVALFTSVIGSSRKELSIGSLLPLFLLLLPLLPICLFFHHVPLYCSPPFPVFPFPSPNLRLLGTFLAPPTIASFLDSLPSHSFPILHLSSFASFSIFSFPTYLPFRTTLLHFFFTSFPLNPSVRPSIISSYILSCAP